MIAHEYTERPILVYYNMLHIYLCFNILAIFAIAS